MAEFPEYAPPENAELEVVATFRGGERTTPGEPWEVAAGDRLLVLAVVRPLKTPRIGRGEFFLKGVLRTDAKRVAEWGPVSRTVGNHTLDPADPDGMVYPVSPSWALLRIDDLAEGEVGKPEGGLPAVAENDDLTFAFAEIDTTAPVNPGLYELMLIDRRVDSSGNPLRNIPGTEGKAEYVQPFLKQYIRVRPQGEAATGGGR